MHESVIPQVKYYPPAPTNMKKHLRVTSDEEKLVSLLCERVLIDHGFRDRTLLPAHPLAKKSLKQLLTDPQSDVFLVFSRTGNPFGEDGFLARSTKIDEKFKYRLYAARNNCYNRRRTTKLTSTRKKLNTPRKQPHRSQLRAMKKTSKIRSFLCVLFSTFSQPLQVCIFQRSLRQRRDALKVPYSQRCRKNAVLAVFSRLRGVIWRGKAFREQ